MLSLEWRRRGGKGSCWTAAGWRRARTSFRWRSSSSPSPPPQTQVGRLHSSNLKGGRKLEERNRGKENTEQQPFRGSGSVPAPDPAFHFDADPDPDSALHFDADSNPDSAFHFDTDRSGSRFPLLMQIRIQLWCLSMRIRIRNTEIQDPGWKNPVPGSGINTRMRITGRMRMPSCGKASFLYSWRVPSLMTSPGRIMHSSDCRGRREGRENFYVEPCFIIYSLFAKRVPRIENDLSYTFQMVPDLDDIDQSFFNNFSTENSK